MKAQMRNDWGIALSVAGVLALGLAGFASQGEKGPLGTRPEPQWDRRPLMAQLGLNPTGVNGYEDYLVAADIVNRPDFETHARYLMRLEREATLRETERVGEEEPWPPEPPGMSPKTSVLEAKKLIVQRFGRIVDLVRQGNLKPVRDPRKRVEADTLFPELAYLKTIARFLDWAATARFSEGNSAAATDILLQGMRFTANIRSGSLIASLVGTSCQAILTASFEDHLPQLSERDSARVALEVKRMLDAKPPYEAAFQREREFGLQFLAEAFGTLSKAKEGLAIEDGTYAGIAQILSKLTAPEIDQLRAQALRRADSVYGAVLKRISAGESQWIRRPNNPAIQDPEESLVDPPKTPADVVELLVSSYLMPGHDAALESFARDRIQLRLLRLHALVLRYKWSNGRLPTKLSSAVPEDELIDLVTGSPFQYLSADNSYRIFSVGFGKWGEIDLRYRRKTPPAETGPNNPPPSR